MAFKLAARLAFKAGMEQANPIMLEPIVNVTVRVPDEFTVQSLVISINAVVPSWVWIC